MRNKVADAKRVVFNITANLIPLTLHARLADYIKAREKSSRISVNGLFVSTTRNNLRITSVTKH